MSPGPAWPPRGRGAGRSALEENGLLATRGARPPGFGPGLEPAPGFGPGLAPEVGFGPGFAAAAGFGFGPGLLAEAAGLAAPGFGPAAPGFTEEDGVEAALATTGFVGFGPGFAPAPGFGPGREDAGLGVDAGLLLLVGALPAGCFGAAAFADSWPTP